MAVVKAVGADGEKRKRPARALSQALPQTPPVADPIRLGDLSDFLGYSLKRAQLRIFDDFIGCVAPLQLTPAQFSVLMLVDANPDRNQSEIASTLGILRPNFGVSVQAWKALAWGRGARPTAARRPINRGVTKKGRGFLGGARSLIEPRHEIRLRELLGDDNRELLLAMLGKIAREF